MYCKCSKDKQTPVYVRQTVKKQLLLTAAQECAYVLEVVVVEGGKLVECRGGS